MLFIKIMKIVGKILRNLPELLTAIKRFEKIKAPWLGSRALTITAASNT